VIVLACQLRDSPYTALWWKKYLIATEPAEGLPAETLTRAIMQEGVLLPDHQ
jgi:hypothetical protein